ncbi:MAG: hypothetical protein ACXIUZ_00765 [Lysobacteraceae bacterium]
MPKSKPAKLSPDEAQVFFERRIIERMGLDHPGMAQSLAFLYDWFTASGLCDANFHGRIRSDDMREYTQALSEMIVASKVGRAGFRLRPTMPGSPDIKAVAKDGRTWWFEVVTPEPSDDLKPLVAQVGASPGDRINTPWPGFLLRWTQALNDKVNQARRHRASAVAADDIYIIVVNSRLLRGRLIVEPAGIGHLPNAVMAVFPIGPPQIFGATGAGELKINFDIFSPKTSVRKREDVRVSTELFSTPEHAFIDAVWGLECDEEEILVDHMERRDKTIHRDWFASDLVLNPFSRAGMDPSPLPWFRLFRWNPCLMPTRALSMESRIPNDPLPSVLSFEEHRWRQKPQ